jgi:nicotinamidase-related amidase
MNRALVIVDMQNFFLKNMKKENKKQLINNQLCIIDYCVENNIPIIELEYAYPGENRGKTISQLPKQYIPKHTITKFSNGGFTKTDLDIKLQELNIGEIILIGINASGCVQDTAIGGLNRKYKITTAKGIIANTWSNDLDLSKSNSAWYQSKTQFLDSAENLVKYL